jgi:hypothetical protein
MEATFGVARVLSGNESWMYLNDSHTHLPSVSDDERAVRVGLTIASQKHMLAVLWSIKGPLVIESLRRGAKFQGACFRNIMIAKLVQALYPRGAVPNRRKFSLHLDNAHPRNYTGTTGFVEGTIPPMTRPAIFVGCSASRLSDFLER